MRIAVIGTRGPAGPARDAIDKALAEICPRLMERGHRVAVFSERNGRSFAPMDGIPLIRLPSLRWNGGSTHPLLSSLISAARGFDVVNFFAAESSGLFTAAARMGLFRTVVSVHGPACALAGNPARNAAARHADVITVTSRRMERLFRQTYGREPIYIPNGIDLLAPPPETDCLAELGLEPGNYLLIADRLEPRSGIHLALAAHAEVENAPPLVIAALGPGDPDYAQGLAGMMAKGRTLLIDQPEKGCLDALLAHSYLYLLPSQTEDSLDILTTALALGRAVLVSDLPDQMDLIGPDGFTFTAGDPGDLRRVLAWLAADPEVVARMRARATASVGIRYGWDRVAESYEQVYRALL